ncbi:MAG: hypothetical protein ACOCZ5_00890 [bacterium]
MPSNTQIANKLFYKSLGKGYTNNGDPFYSQDPSVDGYPRVITGQIWTQDKQIPESSPFGSPNSTDMSDYDGSISGVVQYKHNVELISKTLLGDNAFYSPELKDAIPFNTGDGTYNYAISKQSGDSIPFGSGDWIIDIDQGLLTFNGDVPGGVDSTNPPRVSFYKYIGNKGLGTLDASGTSHSQFQIDTDASGVILENDDGNLNIRREDGSLGNIRAHSIDVSTLKLDNKNGILEAVDGSVYATSVQSLKSRELTIYGDGTTTDFNLNHGLNTMNHNVTLYDASTHEEIYADIIRGSSNSVVEFNTAPESGQNYDAVIMGF